MSDKNEIDDQDMTEGQGGEGDAQDQADGSGGFFGGNRGVRFM